MRSKVHFPIKLPLLEFTKIGEEYMRALPSFPSFHVRSEKLRHLFHMYVSHLCTSVLGIYINKLPKPDIL
jgi:hypothetical protein